MKTKAEDLTPEQALKAEEAMEKVISTVLQHFSYYQKVSGEFIEGVMAHEHFNGHLWAEDFDQTRRKVRKEIVTLREEIRKSKMESV